MILMLTNVPQSEDPTSTHDASLSSATMYSSCNKFFSNSMTTGLWYKSEYITFFYHFHFHPSLPHLCLFHVPPLEMAVAKVDKSRRIVAVALPRYLGILLRTLNLVLMKNNQIRSDSSCADNCCWVEVDTNGGELNCNHTWTASNLHLCPPGLWFISDAIHFRIPPSSMRSPHSSSEVLKNLNTVVSKKKRKTISVAIRTLL